MKRKTKPTDLKAVRYAVFVRGLKPYEDFRKIIYTGHKYRDDHRFIKDITQYMAGGEDLKGIVTHPGKQIVGCLVFDSPARTPNEILLIDWPSIKSDPYIVETTAHEA